ncbi:apolipoprotein N-acyltransferase [Aquifex sp.]
MFIKRLKEFLLGLGAGVLFYLAYSKYELYYLVFVAFYLGLRKEKLTFFTFGFTAYFLSLLWLRLPIIQSGDYPYVYALLGSFLIILLVFLIQFGPTFLLWKFFKFNWLSLPFIFVSVEVLRSYFPFSGFPWLLAGTPLINVPLLKYSLIPLTVYGGSLVVLSLSLLPRFKKGKLPVILGIISLSLLGYALHERRTPPPNTKVAIIQTNIPQFVKLNEELFEKKYPLIIELIKEAQAHNPDIIVLPESTVPFFLDEITTKGKELLELSQKTPIILGIIEIEEEFTPYNSVVLLYKGKVVDIYRKRILVPFGEYTPFPFKYLSFLIPYFGLTDYERGEGPKCFRVKNISVGTPICFEVAYPFYIKNFKCELLAIVTNDGWFLNSDGTYQHMRMARVRAFENGVFILWVNNTGPSAVISPEGEVIKHLPYGQRGILFFSF